MDKMDMSDMSRYTGFSPAQPPGGGFTGYSARYALVGSVVHALATRNNPIGCIAQPLALARRQGEPILGHPGSTASSGTITTVAAPHLGLGALHPCLVVAIGVFGLHSGWQNSSSDNEDNQHSENKAVHDTLLVESQEPPGVGRQCALQCPLKGHYRTHPQRMRTTSFLRKEAGMSVSAQRTVGIPVWS